MSSAVEGDRARRGPRSDALRNQERLLEAAKQAFADIGPNVSLEEIARRAGVGIATLYRNFPTREAVVEAVFLREVEQLAQAATDLLTTLAPGDALHEWLRLSVRFSATKKGLGPALSSITTQAALFDRSKELLTKAVTLLTERASEHGDIRPVAQPIDLVRALKGFYDDSDSPEGQSRAFAVVDLLMAGLRASPAQKPRSRPRASRRNKH